MRQTRLLATCLAVVVVAAALLSGAWTWAADRLDEGVAAWAEAQRARGYAIAYEGPEIGGFPFGLTARFAAPRVESPAGWLWEGPPVAGAAKIWAPLTIAANFPGRHLIAREVGGRLVEGELEAGLAEALISLRIDGQVEAADLWLGQAVWSDPLTGSIMVQALSAMIGPPERRDGSTKEQRALAGEAIELMLPETADSPLGRRVETLRLRATLNGTLPPGDLRGALEQWRTAGGTLDLHEGELLWGPLSLVAEGTLSLDRELRPLGALTARLGDLAETLDALAAAGVIESGQALAVEIALMALAGERDADGNKIVVVPISLQNGWLYLGPVPLLRLSPVL